MLSANRKLKISQRIFPKNHKDHVDNELSQNRNFSSSKLTHEHFTNVGHKFEPSNRIETPGKRRDFHGTRRARTHVHTCATPVTIVGHDSYRFSIKYRCRSSRRGAKVRAVRVRRGRELPRDWSRIAKGGVRVRNAD